MSARSCGAVSCCNEFFFVTNLYAVMVALGESGTPNTELMTISLMSSSPKLIDL
jgi:hypothetical protein